MAVKTASCLPTFTLPLAEALPNAALTILPDQGHMPQHGDPQAIIDAVDRASVRAGLR